jgi:hypothetical protein
MGSIHRKRALFGTAGKHIRCYWDGYLSLMWVYSS